MATARHLGGVDSVNGVNATGGLMMHVLGFQAGYNMASNDTYNVFAKIENFDVLLAIEAWCKNHPAKTFELGLIALANRLSNVAQ